MSRPHFRHFRSVALGGAVLTLVSVFILQTQLPQSFSLAAWQPDELLPYAPGWLVDDLSWPYLLSLSVMVLAILLTSVVRPGVNPLEWASSQTLTAVGMLAIMADNPVTLLLGWVAIDLVELLTTLVSAKTGHRNSMILTFTMRTGGTVMLMWASVISYGHGIDLDLHAIPAEAGFFLLLAAGLRMGIPSLHLPYQDSHLRRGFGTTLRLVSAASSLALLGRIPPEAVASSFTPLLLVLVSLGALYSGWKWLQSPNELTGRPFWTTSVGLLVIASALRGNPTGSIAWGLALILTGEILFIYSAKHRSLVWLPLLAMLGLSALPYTLTGTGWVGTEAYSIWFLLLLIPAQAFLLAGYFKHIHSPSETSLRNQTRWNQVAYSSGLGILTVITLLLGFWGWRGAGSTGLWWAGPIALLISILLTLRIKKIQLRVEAWNKKISRWPRILPLHWLNRLAGFIFEFIGNVVAMFTSAIEGDGGFLWSLLLLVLLISLMSQGI